jgi:hypothetical protein
MSIISRILGKSPPRVETPPAQPSPLPVERAPRPDHAARAREEESQLAAAIAASDTAAIARWVLAGSSTAVRQAAAQAIVDPDQLRELIRATRGGKDKNVYRILTATRDGQLAAERALQEQQDEIEAVSTAIARHSERAHDALYAATLSQLESRWRAVAAGTPTEVQATVTQQLQRAHAVVDDHRRALVAEKERQQAEARARADAQTEARRQRALAAEIQAAAATAQAQAAAAALEAARQAERARLEAHDAAVRHLVGLLRQAQAAIDYGGTARAVKLRGTIAEALPGAPPLPAWFERKLQEVDAKLEELKDWKTFTVVPKRAELLERMQGLIGADMSPEALAGHIRHLRDEWRTLKRGPGDEPGPEVQQFEDAANRAYEPCREHFARQAAQREENQAQREALLERLTAFAAAQAAEAPDVRAINAALTESRQEWQRHAPVDQSVARPLQERFRAVTDDLRARLDQVYTQNIEAKRALIARAAELVKLEDTRAAIDAAKTLQRDWKSVGIVPWSKEFRQHCDAIFQRSAHEFAAHGAALETNQARALAMCEELERIAALSGEPLQAGMHQAQALRTEFESLELPRASARELRHRFAQAGDRCGEAVRKERATAARQGWSELFEAADKVRAYALAVVQHEPAEDLYAAAANAVADLRHAPKGTPALLQRHLDNVAAGSFSKDLSANEKTLRLLCVRTELLTERPTPAEDQELRREHQLQRLVATMGRGERPARDELDDLAQEWISAGPVEARLYQELVARFREQGRKPSD